MGGGLKNIKTLDIFDYSLGNNPDTRPNFYGMTFYSHPERVNNPVIIIS